VLARTEQGPNQKVQRKNHEVPIGYPVGLLELWVIPHEASLKCGLSPSYEESVIENKRQVLICDDDSLYHLTLKAALKPKYECRSAYTSDEALAILRNHSVDVLLLDVQMRTPTEGLEAISKVLEFDPDLPIVMISGNIGFETVKKALTLGAVDYIPKDFNPDDLKHVLQRVLERKALIARREQQNFEVGEEQKKRILIGDSSPIKEVRRLIDKFASSPANVMIFGETGCGKEVVARLLRGKTPDGTLAPFVAVDSSTIQSSMAESTLFGHERGAFTGAEKMNKGVFEEANGGVVYFDEIANMPLGIQVKLLRVVQEKEVIRLGSTRTIKLDFRVVCASNRDLDEMVGQGSFKPDLLQRLNVLPIRLPPLRERIDDIPLLVEHFLKQEPRKGLRFSEEALDLLKEYPWPGNVRELMNVISFTATMAESDLIDIADLPPRFRDSARPPRQTEHPSFYDQVAAFERKLISEAYSGCEGNVSKLALALGMDRSHLYTKLREYGLHSKKK
jgi:DNA-binding NtrC family response regulator